MDGFGDGGSESFRGGAELGESSLQAEREKEGSNGDNNQRGAESVAAESKND